ncbi:MAG: peroxidase-related enzyme [Bacteroidetes bacterium]|nr:peroxidase-related enzyme [Bacteroidota bacterium]
MAFIRMIQESEATGEVRDLYERYRAPWGGVDNILKIHSLLPSTLAPHVDLYRSVMFGRGRLTRRQREMIATVVSRENGCPYCIHHHSDALFRLTEDRSIASLLRSGGEYRGLPPEEVCMLEYAEALTRDPASDRSRHVEKLKEHGFSEESILLMTLIVGYFNFVNRIANGLGVELETYWGQDGFSDPDQSMAHDPE